MGYSCWVSRRGDMRDGMMLQYVQENNNKKGSFRRASVRKGGSWDVEEWSIIAYGHGGSWEGKKRQRERSPQLEHQG